MRTLFFSFLAIFLRLKLFSSKGLRAINTDSFDEILFPVTSLMGEKLSLLTAGYSVSRERVT